MSKASLTPPPATQGIQAAFVKILPDAVQARGLSADPVWAALEISPPDSALPLRVPLSKLCRAVDVACQLTGDSSVILQAAQAVRPLHLGSLGYALLSSAQGEDGLLVYERFQTLLCDQILARHRIAKGLVEVTHEAVPGTPLPRHAHFWWLMLGARLCFARWVSGRNLAPVRMDIPAPRPPQADAFDRLIGCMVRYDTPDCREWMPTDWLGWLNPNADPALHTLMQLRTAQQLASQPEIDPLLARARLVLGGRMSQGQTLKLEEVVGALNEGANPVDCTTARQLQKRLANQGLSFKELIEEVRRDRALRALRDTDRAILEIAHACGYTEVSPFHRAVRRWTGMTPAQVRQQR